MEQKANITENIQEQADKMIPKILDVTCGDRTIWFQKNEPHTIYCDKRREEWDGRFGNVLNKQGQKKRRRLVIDPDVQCDFTDLPFPDNSFSLVVFDPPPYRKPVGKRMDAEKLRISRWRLETDDPGRFCRMYEGAKTGRSACVQVVRHIHFDTRDPKCNRTGTAIRTQKRKEDEHAFDVFYEV